MSSYNTCLSIFLVQITCPAEQLSDFFSFANLPDPFLGTVITTAIGLASLIAFAFMTDKLGRRLPICISYSMMGVSLWSIGGLYYAPPASSGSAIVSVPISLMCVIALTVIASTRVPLAGFLCYSRFRLLSSRRRITFRSTPWCVMFLSSLVQGLTE